MMLNQKNNEHTEERDGLWRKAKHTIFGSVCSDSFDAFHEIKWRGNKMVRKLIRRGGSFVWPPLIIVRGRKLVLRANAIRFS